MKRTGHRYIADDLQIIILGASAFFAMAVFALAILTEYAAHTPAPVQEYGIMPAQPFANAED